MWKLNNPTLEKAIEDIPIIIEKASTLAKSDTQKLKDVVFEYDSNKGILSKSTYDSFPQKKRDEIKTLYKKTEKGGALSYIREQLLQNVGKCPICGIDSVSQLDHHLAESKYGELAVCRLNLVPMCGSCNNAKRTKDGASFPHPYYDVFPASPFLIVKLTVEKETQMPVWTYDVDKDAFKDEDLYQKVCYQVNELGLIPKWETESNSFLTEAFCSMHFDDSDEFKSYLQNQVEQLERCFGLNHWKTALFRSLYESEAFSVDVANILIASLKSTECLV